MAQITIEVPASLAKRLTAVRDRLPEVLARGLDELTPRSHEMYRYVLEFLTSNPAPEAIVDFKPTPAMQARISELLDKNRAGQLTEPEAAELDEYELINRCMRKFKIQALQDLKAPS